jgi:predicted peptidase
MPQEALKIRGEFPQPMELGYLRNLPPGYGDEPEKKWPLILFLHGAGERGSDLNMLKRHGIPKIVEKQKLPFITLSPQCPDPHWWSDFLPLLEALVEETMQTHAVDPDRVYLTGISMGGFGTWHLASEYPNRFAAIAPICGGGPWMFGFPEKASCITHVPVWAFHGAQDNVVPIECSEQMVTFMKDSGGNVQYTVYPNAAHDSWTRTYNDPQLYKWFLSHQRACVTPEEQIFAR